MRRREYIKATAVVGSIAVAGCEEGESSEEPDELPSEPENIRIASWQVGPSEDLDNYEGAIISVMELQSLQSDYSISGVIGITVDTPDNQYSTEQSITIASSETNDETIAIADEEEFPEEVYRDLLAGELSYDLTITVGDEERVNTRVDQTVVASSDDSSESGETTTAS